MDSVEELTLHSAACSPPVRRKGSLAARSPALGATLRRPLVVLSRSGSASEYGGSSEAAGGGSGNDADAAASQQRDDRAMPSSAPRPHLRSNWGELTTRLVAVSTIPFLFLFLPQLLKNHANLAAGRPDALAGLSWLVRFLELPMPDWCCARLLQDGVAASGALSTQSGDAACPVQRRSAVHPGSYPACASCSTPAAGLPYRPGGQLPAAVLLCH